MATRDAAAYSELVAASRCTARPAGRRHLTLNWRSNMTWETPAAIDLRFGFEITMYIAAR